MFKKTLVAMTVVGMSNAAMGAVTVASATLAPTPQRITTDPAFSSSALTATFNANYAVGDTISIALSHPVDATQVFATTAIATGTNNCTNNGDTMSVTYAGYAAATNTVTYTVNQATARTLGCPIAFPAIKFDGAVAAAADTITASFTTSKGFGTLEATATPYKVIDVAATQYTVTIGTPLNGIIDVSKQRYEFTAGTNDVVTATLANSGTSAATFSQLQATSTMTVTGDFSWAKVTSAAGVVTYPGVGLTGVGTGLTVTDTSATWVAPTASAYVLTLTPQAKALGVVLPKTGFALSTAVAYKKIAADTTVLSSAVASTAGAWTLNGASITAYGMPNSASTENFLWVANTGTEEGAISVDVTCDGVTTTGIVAGTATAKTNVRISSIVQNAVDAAGTCAATSRYDASVTVNAPVANIALSAGYKVTAADGATDRLTLETSDSLD